MKMWKGKKLVFLLGIIFLVSPVLGYNCKIKGCPPDEICMADGECTNKTVKEYCENNGFPYTDVLLNTNCDNQPNWERINLCKQCQGDYRYRKNIGDIKGIIYSVAAGIAILLLIINGYRLLTSSDVEARENAKRAIIFVILGLILLMGAGALVETIFLKTPPSVNMNVTTTSSTSTTFTTTFHCMLVGNCPDCLAQGCEWCQNPELGSPLCVDDCDIPECYNCVKVKANCGVTTSSTTTISGMTCSQECQDRGNVTGTCRYRKQHQPDCEPGEEDIGQDHCNIFQTCCCSDIPTTTTTTSTSTTTTIVNVSCAHTYPDCNGKCTADKKCEKVDDHCECQAKDILTFLFVPLNYSDFAKFKNDAERAFSDFKVKSPVKDCSNPDARIKAIYMGLSECDKGCDSCTSCLKAAEECAADSGYDYDYVSGITPTASPNSCGCAPKPGKVSWTGVGMNCLDWFTHAHVIGRNLGLSYIKVDLDSCGDPPDVEACLPPNEDDCNEGNRHTFIMSLCNGRYQYGNAAYKHIKNNKVTGLGKWLEGC